MIIVYSLYILERLLEEALRGGFGASGLERGGLGWRSLEGFRGEEREGRIRRKEKKLLKSSRQRKKKKLSS